MAAKRRPGTRLITGDKELDAALQRLKLGTANKVARPALAKGARVLLKNMKGRVPPDKKYIKRALGMVVDAKGGEKKDEQRAKVGAGVGKSSKVEAKRSGKNTGGVGIGGPNVHWALLGTGQRKTESGRSTGAMPPQVPGLVQDAAKSSAAEVKSAIREEATRRLTLLVAKKK